MSQNTRPQIIRHLDDRGRPVIWVPVDNRGERWAMLEEADFDKLPAHIQRAPWFTNSNGQGRDYVKTYSAHSSGHLVIIARLVLGAGPKAAVRYASSNRLDLRRSNISLERCNRAKRDHLGEVLRAEAA